MSKSENVLIQKNVTTRVRGSGSSLNDAVDGAFAELRKNISQLYNVPIITMSASEVKILDEKISEKEEAFLYFFSKRVKKTYELELEITVSISFIDFERR